jgi:flagellar biosynthesis protein FlhB
VTIHHYLNLVMPYGWLARLVVALVFAVVVFRLGVLVLGVWLLGFSAIAQSLDRHGLNHAVKRCLCAVAVVEVLGVVLLHMVVITADFGVYALSRS